MRIVRLANFVSARSGGLRTALRYLGEGYQEAGHEAVLIIPGREFSDETTAQGRVITLPGTALPLRATRQVMGWFAPQEPADFPRPPTGNAGLPPALCFLAQGQLRYPDECIHSRDSQSLHRRVHDRRGGPVHGLPPQPRRDRALGRHG